MIVLAPPEQVEGAQCETVSETQAIEIVHELFDEMKEFLKQNQGKGLAGPQIGKNLKFFMMATSDGEYKIFFNSKYYGTASRTQSGESCLTYGKDRYYRVKRYKAIQAHYQELVDDKLVPVKVNVRGFDAIAFQHETDHLYGETIAMKGDPIKNN